jgi:GNAT superfamily N-acetyltransferase
MANRIRGMRRHPASDETLLSGVRRVSAEETRPLRSAVLRPGEPFERNVYPGDDSGFDAHFGLFEGPRLVAVASMFAEPPPGQAVEGAWRLRGVSVQPDRQGRGYGRALMGACREHALAQGGRLLWCNARGAAVPFYRKLGFQPMGQPAQVPGEGSDKRMVLWLE